MSTPTFTSADTLVFASLVTDFLNFNSSKSENKQELKSIENKLKSFSKSDYFFQIAFDFIVNKSDASY